MSEPAGTDGKNDVLAEEQISGEFEGSAGDIGSGPTGDIRPNDAVGPGKGLAENPLVLVVAAFVVGLAIGRWTTR